MPRYEKTEKFHIYMPLPNVDPDTMLTGWSLEVRPLIEGYPEIGGYTEGDVIAAIRAGLMEHIADGVVSIRRSFTGVHDYPEDPNAAE